MTASVLSIKIDRPKHFSNLLKSANILSMWPNSSFYPSVVKKAKVGRFYGTFHHLRWMGGSTNCRP